MKKIKHLQLLALLFLSSAFYAQDNNKKANIDSLSLYKTKYLASPKGTYDDKYLMFFPNTFDEFKAFFGYDEEKKLKAPLYNASFEYVDVFFKILIQKKEYSKLLAVATNGKWNADAENFLQAGLHDVLKNNPSDFNSQLKKLKKEEQISVWYFIFDGLHLKKEAPEYVLPLKKVDLKEYTDVIALRNNFLRIKDINTTLSSHSWQIQCTNRLAFIDIDNTLEGYMSLFSNTIYANVMVESIMDKPGEYWVKFKSYEPASGYTEKENLNNNAISKMEPIAKIIFKNNKLELQWFGLYNTKSNQRDFVNDFVIFKENSNKLPIILNKCDN